VWVTGMAPAETRAIAAKVRSDSVRALGLVVGEFTQVSCNLVDPGTVGPAEAYDKVAAALPEAAHIVRAELVGLVPSSVLTRTPEDRWPELGLSAADALEARLGDQTLKKLRS